MSIFVDRSEVVIEELADFMKSTEEVWHSPINFPEKHESGVKLIKWTPRSNRESFMKLVNALNTQNKVTLFSPQFAYLKKGGIYGD